MALYIRTGALTSPNEIAPDQIARGMDISFLDLWRVPGVAALDALRRDSGREDECARGLAELGDSRVRPTQGSRVRRTSGVQNRQGGAALRLDGSIPGRRRRGRCVGRASLKFLPLDPRRGEDSMAIARYQEAR